MVEMLVNAIQPYTFSQCKEISWSWQNNNVLCLSVILKRERIFFKDLLIIQRQFHCTAMQVQEIHLLVCLSVFSLSPPSLPLALSLSSLSPLSLPQAKSMYGFGFY